MAWKNKAVALSKLDKFKEAIDCYDKGLEINPNDAEVWYRKGYAYYEMRIKGEARRCYNKAKEINPDFRNEWYGGSSPTPSSLGSTPSSLTTKESDAGAIASLHRKEEEEAKSIRTESSKNRSSPVKAGYDNRIIKGGSSPLIRSKLPSPTHAPPPRTKEEVKKEPANMIKEEYPPKATKGWLWIIVVGGVIGAILVSVLASSLLTSRPPSEPITPPVISVPDDIVVEATSSDGAVVEFEVTAEDNVDGAADVNCDHTSGDTFPTGDTVVTCSSVDAAENRAEESFTITVKDTKPQSKTGAVTGTRTGVTTGVFIVPGSSSLTTDAYQPDPVQVSVGGTVTWTNDDSQPHTATSGENVTPDYNFDSGIMAPAATFEHTFTEAGYYPYFCLLHPNMVGTVVVPFSE